MKKSIFALFFFFYSHQMFSINSIQTPNLNKASQFLLDLDGHWHGQATVITLNNNKQKKEAELQIRSYQRQFQNQIWQMVLSDRETTQFNDPLTLSWNLENIYSELDGQGTPVTTKLEENELTLSLYWFSPPNRNYLKIVRLKVHANKNKLTYKETLFLNLETLEKTQASLTRE